ncbi:MAG: DUF3052 family protein [Dehalococcoidia bacterium]|nr:DUF3052 family protein [Dehalococcoidia bacterium]
MAGYSRTPLPTKLGIKPGHMVVLANAPGDFADVLGELPEGVTVSTHDDRIDVALLFVTSSGDLAEGWPPLAAAIRPAGGLWVCWPKKASGVETDLTENVIRDFGLSAGLVDNKVCAVDETWSGLRFVYRLKDR